MDHKRSSRLRLAGRGSGTAAGGLEPGRVRHFLGAVLAAALMGRRLNWCLGARFSPPPVEYHAWAELPGHGPVGEYTEAGWHHHTALTI
ncbi:hypothetical protein ACIQM0_25655 [Streptomyces sp. NPDC091387]|uniref:hypothetical protein n=1 Tax=Streptomyces sp. NPDC091387 TaxID=3365998 RepID=UPI0037FF0E75